MTSGSSRGAVAIQHGKAPKAIRRYSLNVAVVKLSKKRGDVKASDERWVLRSSDNGQWRDSINRVWSVLFSFVKMPNGAFLQSAAIKPDLA
jgi:hypothetical protein